MRKGSEWLAQTLVGYSQALNVTMVAICLRCSGVKCFT